MKQCNVYCVNTKSDSLADILVYHDKQIRVVFVGTNISLTLSRKDIRRPYIGFAHGMEFETFGEME